MRKEFIILTWGGIGDVLLCTPAIKALKEANPDHKVIIYYDNFKKEHRKVFLNSPHVDSLRELGYKTLWRYPYHLYLYLSKKYKERYYFLHFQHVPPTWIYNKNNKEIAADIFGLQLKDDRVQLFLTKKEEDSALKTLASYRDKPVVLMHVYSRTSKNHMWDKEKWELLISRLPEYNFIQIGSSDEPYINGAVDFRGKTTLREAFGLLKFTTSFVGVESCFAHVTNAFDIPGVVLFGDSSPLYWGHSNNINIYKGVSCAPCYHYLWGKACPYGNECMKLITVEEVQEALVLQIARSIKPDHQMDKAKISVP
jgi:ADP-heptose:LPS heptosyltransferase